MKLPPAGSLTAEMLIDAALKKRNYPANPINAARAGWEAARAALAEPVADEPAPGYCKHCKKYTIAEPLPAERGELPSTTVDYPPLPEPAQSEQSEGYMSGCPDLIPATPDFYTADQMRAYVDADRAQRVPLTTDQVFASQDLMYLNGSLLHLAMPELIEVIRTVERAHGIGALRQGVAYLERAKDAADTQALEWRDQLNALRADAERYRWLRLKVYVDPQQLILRIADTYLNSGKTTVADELDAAIDAARQSR